METPYLREVCDLLKTYSDYNTNAKIGQKVGISARTLSGYWEQDKTPAGIPEKNVPAFISLLQEVIRSPLSAEGAKLLLTSNPVALHNRLMPFSGAWGELLDAHKNAPPLETKIHKFGMNFGATDDEPFVPQVIAAMYQGFNFTIKLGWPGELCLIAEKDGEWRIISLRPNERTIMAGHGEQTIPPPKEDGSKNPLKEKQAPGYYRYFLIARRGKFDETIRHSIAQANPFTTAELDILGNHLLSLPKSGLLVRCALMKIED
jgi:hypothetical protein